MLGALHDFDGDALTGLWRNIGLTEAEQAEEMAKLNGLVRQAIETFQAQFAETEQNLKDQIRSTWNAYQALSNAFGVAANAHLVDAPRTSLRSRLAEITAEYEAFKAAHQARITEFDALHAEVSSLFTKLEIPEDDRGEFATLGCEDYTALRLQRFTETRKLLHEHVTTREGELSKRQASIENLSRELEAEIPDDIALAFQARDISAETLRKVAECEVNLKATKQLRESEIDRQKLVLLRLWDALKISAPERDSFANQWPTLGDSVLEGYANEITKLKAQRQEHLPEIIRAQLAEINRIEAELHRPLTQFAIEGQDANTLYDILERIFDGLQAEQSELRPLLELIAQRTELLKELDDLNESAKLLEETRLKKKEVDLKKVSKDEQARRRIRSLLPRLEKKLLIALLDYHANKEQEFLWDGQPYVEHLGHIKLSDVELRQAKTARKKSVQPSRRASQLGPLDDGEKAGSRRSLENRLATLNHPK
jgi:hypothetical protein